MKRVPAIILFSLICIICPGQTPGQKSEELLKRYPLIIQAPGSQESWDAWRMELKSWRDSLLSIIHYDNSCYLQPQYRWAARSYSVLFLMANDHTLYDTHWNYDIEEYLNKYERDYGAVDIVLLWATYPQLGFDNRDQFDFYCNMPGGLPALKQMCNELHAMGKRLMIAYNPWDNIARLNGKSDEEELINLVRAIGADGIFLDTISKVEGFREKLSKALEGVVFQAEIGIDPSLLSEIHQSWQEIYPGQEELNNAPGIVRNRFLEQHHMVYRLSRWSHEQSYVIHSAWINGCGVVLWENVFGTVNELNLRDRSLLKAMLPVMRRYSNLFTEGKWSPLVHTLNPGTFSSLWEFDNKKLWTLINSQEQFISGGIIETDFVKDVRYYDLITGKESRTAIAGNKVIIYMDLNPRGLAGILAISQNDINDDFNVFLNTQAANNSNADFATTFTLRRHNLKTVQKTVLYAVKDIPDDMKIIPVHPDSMVIESHFRQRECGFYPAQGVTDFSFTRAYDQPGVARRIVKLTPYAMDETLVTNAQYEKFIQQTGYTPKNTENFLKHWINGKPSKGMEDCPVTWISLEDARAYARWKGKRLPTEEEWQWAAASGGKKWDYPWGNEYNPALCNHGQTKNLTPVREFLKGRTAEGIYDMCGNAWQFTESERDDGINLYCIVRGGSWYITQASGWYADQGPQKSNFAAKYLLTWPGLDRCATLGFRCVVDIK